MATVITVHGTNDTGPAEGSQWWQMGSFFDEDMRSMVEAEDGELAIEPSIWDGRNSETSRRNAGTALATEMKELEERNEPYCLIGHSHGGSVLASALLETVVNRQGTESLKTWITVGTPFVRLRRERLLFSRLPNHQKAILVGLLSFGLILLGTVVLGLMYGDTTMIKRLHGDTLGITARKVGNFLLYALAVSAVFILSYGFLFVRDRRRFRAYRTKTTQEADRRFSPLWTSFCHEDDEAVQGLHTLGKANLKVFDKKFAAPLFTSAAVFVLPILYFLIVFSPATSTALASLIAQRIYPNDNYATLNSQISELSTQDFKLRVRQWEIVFTKFRSAVNGKYQELMPRLSEIIESSQLLLKRQKQEREAAEDPARLDSDLLRKQERERTQQSSHLAKLMSSMPPSLRKLPALMPEEDRKMRVLSQKMKAFRDEIQRLRRVRNFADSFLDPQGSLVEAGGNPFKNSELVLRMITADFHNFVKNGFPYFRGAWNWLNGVVAIGSIVAVFVLVPLFFAAISLMILYVVRGIAGSLSAWVSAHLDRLTMSEMRRTALGNDTIAEVALTAQLQPFWSSDSRPYLPGEIATEISERSNEVAASSLAKLRNAISELAFTEGTGGYNDLVEKYITWQELIHTTYFHVPRFRKLLAYAISQADGFRPTAAFLADPDYPAVQRWHEALMTPKS